MIDDSAPLLWRPMLSRDADSMYWMARYVERAEHVARIALINSNLLMDVGDLAPDLHLRQWLSVLEVLRLHEQDIPGALIAAEYRASATMEWRIRQYLTFGESNPSSLLNCLTHARENARAIRESISAEMWESINGLYWSIRGDDAQQRFEESPEEFFRGIMTGSMLFQGLTDQTLAHDQPWLFTQVAKYLERIDVTARVIETKYAILDTPEEKPTLTTGAPETALRNIHWMAVLRSCCSIEAYRRNHVGEMDATRVASFLLLHRTFPRSIRFCVERAAEAMATIRTQTNPGLIDPAERILGRLSAQLEFAEMSEVFERGLVPYLRDLEAHISDAAFALQTTYFRH